MPEKRSRLQTHGNGSEKMDHRFCSHRPPRARGRPPCAGASRSAWPAANEMIQPVFLIHLHAISLHLFGRATLSYLRHAISCGARTVLNHTERQLMKAVEHPQAKAVSFS